MTTAPDDVATYSADADALQALLDAYRAMVPVKDVIALLKSRWSTDGDAHWSSLATQARVVASVVRDPVCDKYPPHNSYVYRFIKTYMSEIESVGAEAHDELVAELIEFVVHARLDDMTLRPDDLHHVSFRIPRSQSSQSIASTTSEDSFVVTCRVASVFNDVGLKIWQAGWYLAEYVVAYAEAFTDATVLELGAGVGLTGIVLAGTTKPKRVVLTDYSPHVLQNLRYNVEVNARQCQCPIDVLALDWATYDPQSSDEMFQPDVLLAGDCIYDVAVIPALVRVLQSFLNAPEHLGSQTRQQRRAIFAATIRNRVTFATFLDVLAHHAIAVDDVTVAAQARMGAPLFPYNEDRDQIRLCVLTRAAAKSPVVKAVADTDAQ